jgi:hypothetical protein
MMQSRFESPRTSNLTRCRRSLSRLALAWDGMVFPMKTMAFAGWPVALPQIENGELPQNTRTEMERSLGRAPQVKPVLLLSVWI